MRKVLVGLALLAAGCVAETPRERAERLVEETLGGVDLQFTEGRSLEPGWIVTVEFDGEKWEATDDPFGYYGTAFLRKLTQ